MAKEIHGYIKTVLVICAIVFAGGGYAMQIRANAKGVVKNTTDIEDVEDNVHLIQINQAKKIATDQAIASSLLELKTGLNSIKTDQAAIKTDIAIMKTKVETLIKD